MAQVHPHAVVDPAAELAEDVVVGPFCYVGPRVRIGPGCHLISHVAIFGPTVLGEHNTLWPQVVLGGDPQDLKYRGEPSELIIGDRNEMREGVSVHRGTLCGGGVTRIGNDNLFMSGMHIAHDCQIGSHIVIANATQLAGHVRIHDHAAIGGMTGIHHFVTIGSYSYVGGMSRIVHDVPPFMIVEGHPCRVRGVNVVGLQRRRFSETTIELLKDACRDLFRGPAGEDEPHTVGNMSQALKRWRRDHGKDPSIAMLLDFLVNCSIGVFGRHQEAFRTDHRFSNPVR